MSDQRKGGIVWTDQTWNPIRGCTRVSAGCENCYAEAMAARFCGAGQPYEGTINPETKRWNSMVRLVPEKLEEPLHWTRPRRIFVNSMSDLFHPSVPDEYIDKVFAVMALCPQHTFQVLTKRPERMRNYLSEYPGFRWIDAIRKIQPPPDGKGVLLNTTSGALPNVWLGVTVENQQAADERIPLLLQTPAAVRWVSVEPMLGRVDLCEHFGMWWNSTMRCFESSGREFNRPRGERGIDWVVCGGESGPKARQMHPDWVCSLRDQCKAAGVPFMFKQWGEWMPEANMTHTMRMADNGSQECLYVRLDGGTHWIDKDDHEEYSASDVRMTKVGKKTAGRLLDGVLHDEYPEGTTT